jgi:hypothetical protein
VSLTLFVLALRHIGTARTGAYFSLAPFVGALISVLILRDSLTLQFLIAAILMGIGVWLHLTERHEHEHFHEAIEHEHRHVHDEHHQHEHDEFAPLGEPHSHPHFAPNARIDMLGFSAGGYLSLILMLEDPEKLFNDSRGVVFASGVPTRDLHLLSPFILDLAAEVAMMRLYVKNIEGLSSARMRHWFEAHGEGQWLRALAGLRADRRRLEARLKQVGSRLLGITNVNDDSHACGCDA